MKEYTDLALDTATRLEASYADIRIIQTQYESVSAKNEKVSGIGRSENEGFGIRVIADGAWGYAASDLVTKSEIERVAAAAVDQLPVVMVKPDCTASQNYITLADEVLSREKQERVRDEG